MATSSDSHVPVPSSKNRGNLGGTAAIAIRRIRPELPPGATPGAQIIMVAGRSIPARVAFDLQSNTDDGHYSWAREIADRCQADVWIMEAQGMGKSNRPEPMSDDCNILTAGWPAGAPGEQTKAFGAVRCQPNWPYHLGGSDSDWQELDAVVDHVRRETLLENPSWVSQSTGRVILIGYSAGAYVVGPYAMQNPAQVWGLLLLAPAFPPDGPKESPPGPIFAPDPARHDAFYGAPMGVFTKNLIWPESVTPPSGSCPKERNDYVIDDLWNAMLENEHTPNLIPGYEVTLWPTRFWWGWNRELVSNNSQLGKDIPVLIIAGTEDKTIRLPKEFTDGRGAFSVESLYQIIAGRGKAMMYDIECASHNIVWQESWRHKLHDLSIEWLRGFANYIGPPSNPAFTPVRLPHDGSGRYLVPRGGTVPQPWNG